MGLLGQSAAELRLLKFLGVGLPAAVAGYILIQPVLQAYSGIDWLPAGGALWMLIPVAGILLLENLYRNADGDTSWALKHLCIAVGGHLYLRFLLFRRRYGVRASQRNSLCRSRLCERHDGSASRPRHRTLALLASGHPRLSGVIFHSFALVGSGLYLVMMAAASYYLRQTDGEWGPSMQIIFLIGGASILAVIFASGSMRARIKQFISRNFFSLKYDYRETWMHFVGALSSTNPR